MSSEIKLEVAEIVAASQAGRVLALTPEGVPVWVDINTLRTRNIYDELLYDKDVQFLWSPANPLYIHKMGIYCSTNLNPIIYEKVDGVDLTELDIYFSLPNSYVEKKFDGVSIVSSLMIIRLEGSAPSNAASFFNSTSNTQLGLSVRTDGKGYSVIRDSSNYAFYTGLLDIDLTAGWHVFYAEAEVREDGTTIRLYQNGILQGSDSTTTVGLKYSSGFANQYVTNKSNVRCALFARLSKRLTTVEQLAYLEQFKLENEIA